MSETPSKNTHAQEVGRIGTLDPEFRAMTLNTPCDITKDFKKFIGNPDIWICLISFLQIEKERKVRIKLLISA